MNKLSTERRAAVLKSLVEGNSVRATCRLTGAAKGTVLRLLVEIGEACALLHDEIVRKVRVRRVQCDEIWSYVGAKEKNVREENRATQGDLWTWVGIDAETKLAISYYLGGRGLESATAFMRDLVSRIANRVQLTTDGHGPYLQAVENAFGWWGVDYGVLQKIYANLSGSPTKGVTSVVVGAKRETIMGRPDEQHISTSFVERQNLTMRMQMRRFTRLTNGYSKKAANHAAAVAIHFVHYNFVRVHHTLTKAKGGIHQTPAMAAGLSDHVWTMEELLHRVTGGVANAA